MLLVLAFMVAGLAAGPQDPAQVAPDQPAAAASAAPAPDPVAPDAPAQAPAPAGSDVPAEAKKPPTPPHTGIHALVSGVIGDIEHLPSVPNMYLGLSGGALAIAVHPADVGFNERLQSHYDVVNDAFAPAKYFGDTPEQVGLSLGTYAWGRLFDEPKVSHLGMDLLRAQIVTEVMVEPLKFATRRERPDGSNNQSFPSGHAAVTFAGATVLERHLGWKHSLAAYVVATYVAMSRLHDNRHYLSDVAFGAAVGTIAGRTVTVHGRDVWTLAPAQAPGGGIAIVAMRTGF
jgi:hypothetical protein